METMYSVITYNSKVVLLTTDRKNAMRKFFSLFYNHVPCRVVMYGHCRIVVRDEKIIAETRF